MTQEVPQLAASFIYRCDHSMSPVGTFRTCRAAATMRNAKISVMMIGPFPILQVVGGLIGGVGGFAVGYQLFSLQKPDLGWFARQLHTLGALAIMGIGMMLGQISGHFLHTLFA